MAFLCGLSHVHHSILVTCCLKRTHKVTFAGLCSTTCVHLQWLANSFIGSPEHHLLQNAHVVSDTKLTLTGASSGQHSRILSRHQGPRTNSPRPRQPSFSSLSTFPQLQIPLSPSPPHSIFHSTLHHHLPDHQTSYAASTTGPYCHQLR